MQKQNKNRYQLTVETLTDSDSEWYPRICFKAVPAIRRTHPQLPRAKSSNQLILCRESSLLITKLNRVK